MAAEFKKPKPKVHENCHHFCAWWDNHLKCVACRGHTCSPEQTCSDCEKWPLVNWDRLNKCQADKEAKKRRKNPQDSGSGDQEVNGSAVVPVSNLVLAHVTPLLARK